MVFKLPGAAISEPSPELLNQQGQQQYAEGNFQAALELWRAATDAYDTEDNAEGAKGTQINQSLALLAIGMPIQACLTGTQALELPPLLCNYQSVNTVQDIQESLLKLEPSQINGLGLIVSAASLRQIGKLNDAGALLDRAASFVSTDPSLKTMLLVGLGNLNATRLKLAQSRFTASEDLEFRQQQTQQIIALLQAASGQWREVAQLQPESSQNRQATLNLIRLWIDTWEWLQTAAAINSDIEQWLTQASSATGLQLIEQIATEVVEPVTLQSLYDQLNLADLLLRSEQSLLVQQLQTASIDPVEVTAQIAIQALTAAERLNNIQALAYSYGLNAMVRERQGNLAEAIQFYQRAVAVAQSVQSWEISYRFNQKLALRYQQNGQTEAALSAYKNAIIALDAIRSNLNAVNPDIQFSFQEEVTPIYRSYLQLLVEQPDRDLMQIISVSNSLKLAELENFLRCGRILEASEPKSESSQKIDLYVIPLRNQVEIIVRSSQGMHDYQAPLDLVLRQVQNLRSNLQSPQLANLNPVLLQSYSQALFQLLLAPAFESNWMPVSGILTFHLDSEFQQIPIGLLYDGTQYLIERYSIVVALDRANQPERSLEKNAKALLAGLSEVSPSFQSPLAPSNISALPAVAAELNSISSIWENTQQLLNQQFTLANFNQSLQQAPEIVHISTHGQFSSDPEKTVLLAWDQLLSLPKFEQILKQNEAEAIRLLVLSACQTAKGDRRSALGLAGIAIQAGTQNTIASLWVVDAESTALLMSEFYRQIASGVELPQALQKAQVMLIQSPVFSHPFFWSPFVLVAAESD